jgi:murein DD-endopeptidase MepM/ murein hydrolase activator NlpD
MLKGLGFTSIFYEKTFLLLKSLPLFGLILLSLQGCRSGERASQITSWDAGTPAPISQEQETTGTPDRKPTYQLNAPAAATEYATSEAAQAPLVYFTLTPTPALTPEQALPFQFCSPLEDHSLADLQEIITFPYDPPPAGKDTGHHGVDFAYYRRGERLSILGVPIHSVLPGKVAVANQNLAPYGFMVIVETLYDELPEPVKQHLGIPPSQSLYLLYAHMNELPLVEEGAPVACGQRLGSVGNTPENWSSAPHLHFEARYGPQGGQFSGMQFYDKRSQVEQMEKYTLWRMSGDYTLLDPLALLVYGMGLVPGEGN